MAAQPHIDQLLTFGVEEEFLLADSRTRVAAARAPEVIEKARVYLGEAAQPEIYATQVEFVSQPHETLDALRADLQRSRQIGAGAAASSECLLVASASAVLTRHPLPIITSTPRYVEMVRRYTETVEGIAAENSGCHIHLGTLEIGEAIELGNHLRPWLPALQALCVNSPFAAGQDRGCASWRYHEAKAWPTTGPAPVLDATAYERLATDLVSTGTVMDRKMIYWYARPSEHWPTLEIRVADANPDLDVIVLYAALVRGLGTTLMAEIRQGRPAPEVSHAELSAAHDAVALTGLTASVHDPLSHRRAPITDVLNSLVQRARPGLEAAGDGETVDRLLAQLRTRGTTAQRQRSAYERRGRLTDVVDSLAIRSDTV